MKLLAFGASGALGTALEIVCKEKDLEYIGLGHNDIEITDKEKISEKIKQIKPDVVVNCVAFIGVNPCELDPKKTFEINSIPVLHIAKICQEENIIFIQPSSHAVFDGEKDEYSENDIPNPLNVYGVSKLAAELFAKNLCKKHYVVRFSTMFGPRKNSSLGFVDKMLNKLKVGEEVRVADDKIDNPTYTIDVANQLIFLIIKKKPFGIYHIVNSGAVSYYDFIFYIAGKINSKSQVIRAKDRDFPTLAPKPSKTAMKSVKLNPMRNWQEAVDEYIREYIDI